jgi:hypothetical protein
MFPSLSQIKKLHAKPGIMAPPIIISTQESEIRRMVNGDQLRQKVHEILSSTNKSRVW